MTERSSVAAPRIALLANVGSRDVFRDGERVQPARDAGEQILSAFDTERGRLTLPILGPTLDYLERIGGRVARVVLFASDQPSTVEEHHRQTDTLHFATIIRRLLEADSHFRGEAVIRLLRENNPTLYDETYPFYQGALRIAKITDGIDRFYVLASGGTPAMNLGLLVATVEQLGDRCDPLYLREGAREPHPLDLGQQLRQATLRRLARQHLERSQFAAAREVTAELDGREAEGALAAYAAARLNFDWDGAWREADRAIAGTAREDRRRFEHLRDQARILGDGSDPGLLLGELYHKARLAYEAGAYKEFLVFLFALDEYALKEIIRRDLAIDFSGDDAGDRKSRLKHVAEQPALQAFLDSRMVGNGKKLCYEQANRPAMRAYLDFLVDARRDESGLGEGRRDVLEEARSIDERLNSPKLARQRNQVVHGVGGASRELIEDAYNSAGGQRRNAVDDLRVLARAAGGKVDDWAVASLRDHLLTRLEH